MKFLILTIAMFLTGCVMPHDLTGRATFTIDCNYTKGNNCQIDVPHESNVLINGNAVVVTWEGVE